MLDDPSFAFTWKEITDMIQLAKVNQRDYTLLSVMALSGRRISEIVGRKDTQFNIPGLQRDDIDYGHKLIKWTIAKKFIKENKIKIGHVVHSIEANVVLLEILAAYIDTLPPEQQKIFPITRQRSWQIVKKYMNQAGIERRRICHAFRHGFAIKFIQEAQRPEDIRLLQTLLDHSNFEQTSTYLRFAKTRKREILDNMNLTTS